MSDEEEAHYELVMPFVVVTSAGGPFDDSAFVAGLNVSQIEAQMQVADALGGLDIVARYVDPRIIPQLDLLGMRHGFRLVLGDVTDDGEWQRVDFERQTLNERGLS